MERDAGEGEQDDSSYHDSHHGNSPMFIKKRILGDYYGSLGLAPEEGLAMTVEEETVNGEASNTEVAASQSNSQSAKEDYLLQDCPTDSNITSCHSDERQLANEETSLGNLNSNTCDDQEEPIVTSETIVDCTADDLTVSNVALNLTAPSFPEGSVTVMAAQGILQPGMDGNTEPSVIQFAPVSTSNPNQPVCLKIFYPPGCQVGGPPLSTSEECLWVGCNKKLGSLDELVNHVNDAHIRADRDVDNDYKCRWEGCPRKGKGFNARYKMLIHVRTHTNEKPHKCSVCGKSFSRLENLKIHNRSHTGEKPYLCPFEGCHKAYSNSSDRFKHVRTHQEEKPYCCKFPRCHKRYTDPSSLRKHIKTNCHFFRGQNSASSRVSKSADTVQSLPALSQSRSAVGAGSSHGGSSVISIHGNMLPMSTLASNPLLSSAVMTHAKHETQTISTQTDSEEQLPESPKDLHVQVLEEEGKCQESPLDLSTSPMSPQGTGEDSRDDTMWTQVVNINTHTS